MKLWHQPLARQAQRGLLDAALTSSSRVPESVERMSVVPARPAARAATASLRGQTIGLLPTRCQQQRECEDQARPAALREAAEVGDATPGAGSTPAGRVSP
jgi:hypothetical protein